MVEENLKYERRKDMKLINLAIVALTVSGYFSFTTSTVTESTTTVNKSDERKGMSVSVLDSLVLFTEAVPNNQIHISVVEENEYYTKYRAGAFSSMDEAATWKATTYPHAAPGFSNHFELDGLFIEFHVSK